MEVYDPLAANEWGKRLERVMDWADELGAAEEITPRLKLKHQQTLEEIHKLHVFLEGLEFLLGTERFHAPLSEHAHMEGS